MYSTWWWVVPLFVAASVTGADIPATCDSKIYCQGDLLREVQRNAVYDDSKTFVDKMMLDSPEAILNRWEALKEREGQNVSREKLEQFVDENFVDSNELVPVNPPDWVENPSILARIADPMYRQWAKELNVLWKNLSRRVSDEVRDNSDRYSLIYVPNNFVIPGGRFTEFYYWDTYWIVRGLLLCDMKETTKGIIENFVYMVENYGIIPNGGRVYYLQRSQPPMLTPMVANYFKATQDLEFVRRIMSTLDKEFQFWMNNRTVHVNKNGKDYTLCNYYAVSEGPRPESYREDYTTAQQNFDTEERRQEFYTDMKSAAESGWDFSSRWFIKDGSNGGGLASIHTRYIIPVDLNAFIFWNAELLSDLHTRLGDTSKAAKYAKIAADWKEAVTAVLWNEEKGSWFDYDLLNNKQRGYFYPSNISPLWTKCYDQSRTSIIARKVVNYIEKSNIRYYLGGIPTSVNKTGEQWDLPNAWPPLQSIIIQGLDETREPCAVRLAYEFAKQWIRSNYKGYQESMEMYEKYDAENPGKYGGGGEYTVQSGFGWTNGVVLELLAEYGKLMSSSGNSRRRTVIRGTTHRPHRGII